MEGSLSLAPEPGRLGGGRGGKNHTAGMMAHSPIISRANEELHDRRREMMAVIANLMHGQRRMSGELLSLLLSVNSSK